MRGEVHERGSAVTVCFFTMGGNTGKSNLLNRLHFRYVKL